jgi:protein O-GlcNAc transferase
LKNYPRVYNALGSAYKQKKEYEESIKLFKRCIEMSPSYEVPYYNLGLICQERGELDEASQYYEESIKINQNYTNPYIGLASLYTQKKGEEDKAIHWLQKCI